MFSALEIAMVIIVLGGLLLLQIRTRTGSLFAYLAVGILLLMLILAIRIIRSLVGVVLVLAVLCIVLLWKFIRSK